MAEVTSSSRQRAAVAGQWAARAASAGKWDGETPHRAAPRRTALDRQGRPLTGPVTQRVARGSCARPGLDGCSGPPEVRTRARSRGLGRAREGSPDADTAATAGPLSPRSAPGIAAPDLTINTPYAAGLMTSRHAHMDRREVEPGGL